MKYSNSSGPAPTNHTEDHEKIDGLLEKEEITPFEAMRQHERLRYENNMLIALTNGGYHYKRKGERKRQLRLQKSQREASVALGTGITAMGDLPEFPGEENEETAPADNVEEGETVIPVKLSTESLDEPTGQSPPVG